jgi:hypothetical protein
MPHSSTQMWLVGCTRPGLGPIHAVCMMIWLPMGQVGLVHFGLPTGSERSEWSTLWSHAELMHAWNSRHHFNLIYLLYLLINRSN